MKSVLGLLVAVYVVYGVAMILVHPTFIYPFGGDRFAAPGWRTEVVEDGAVHLAVSEGDSDVAVVFFMGNGGSLAYFTPSLEAHVAAGRTVVALQFRGGGGIAGTPSEALLKSDALVAFNWLAARHDGAIVVHGYSMGTSLAQYVAAHRDVAGILLDAPFVKMCEIMARASYLPACYLPGVQMWDSAVLVPELSAPVLVQHGDADQLIPISDGLCLADLMRAAELDVTFQAIEGATHNTLAVQPGYGARIDAFISMIGQ